MPYENANSNVIIDLSDIPKKQKQINWSKSIGHKIKFNYYNIIFGEFKIVGFSPDNISDIIIEYNNEKYTVNKYRIASGKISSVVNPSRRKLLYSIGDKIQLKNKNAEFIITNFGIRINKNGKEEIFYEEKCLRCGKTYRRSHTHLKLDACPNCNILKTRIPNEEPWMVKYFQGGYDEAIKYKKTSLVFIKPVCPLCGKIQSKPRQINTIYCSKGIKCSCELENRIYWSYPERFMLSLLEQLNIDYIFQPTADYLNFENRFLRYDFYIPKLKIIIETHGLQHYKSVNYWRNDIDTEKKNDKYKKSLALSNGVDKYIEIDCRNSKLDWIKKSIMDSELPSLLDFNEEDIDWQMCDKYKSEDRIKMICDDYKQNYLTTDELCQKYHLANCTIGLYLNIGTSHGWCSHSQTVNAYKKPFEVLKDGHHIGYFSTLSNAHKYFETEFGISLDTCKIANALKNNIIFRGYSFKYVESIPLRWDILTGKVF